MGDSEIGTPQSAPNDWETVFWKSLIDNDELLLPMCAECGYSPGLPTISCPSCGSTYFNWNMCSTQGEVYSWTTLNRQRHPNFPVPLTVVVVSLLEAPKVHLVCRLVDTVTGDIRVGAHGKVSVSASAGPELQPASLLFEIASA
jgi:uncharacterized protein